MFDHNKFEGLLKILFSDTSLIVRRELVFILGPTDSGKSTSTNYLLGKQMIAHHSDDSFYATINVSSNSNDTTTATIGNKLMTSETLFSTLFKLPNHSFWLCDNPGFEDTRGIEERIIASLNNAITIRSASLIKAVVVTIDLRALSSGSLRGGYLRNLLPIIKNFLHDPEKYQDSILFMFTKIDNYKFVKKLNGYLQTVLNELETNLANETSTTNRQQLSDQIYVLKFIIKNNNNFIFLDPLDEGQSRENFLSKVSSANGIPPGAFNFTEDVRTKIALADYISSQLSDACELFRHTLHTPDALKKLAKDKIRKSNELYELQLQLSTLQKTSIGNDSNIASYQQDFLDIIQGKKSEIEKSNIEIVNARSTMASHHTNGNYQCAVLINVIQNENNKIRELNKSIESLCIENRATLKKLFEKSELLLAEKIAYKKQMIIIAQSDLDSIIKNEDLLQQQYMESKKFLEKRPIYQIIYKILQLNLMSETPLSKEFNALYKQYMQRKHFGNYFSEGNTNIFTESTTRVDNGLTETVPEFHH